MRERFAKEGGVGKGKEGRAEDERLREQTFFAEDSAGRERRSEIERKGGSGRSARPANVGQTRDRRSTQSKGKRFVDPDGCEDDRMRAPIVADVDIVIWKTCGAIVVFVAEVQMAAMVRLGLGDMVTRWYGEMVAATWRCSCGDNGLVVPSIREGNLIC